MELKIALAGNPNTGKTTLFNSLTGSNQFVGNWPGVTVEKKEGRLKKYEGVKIIDLPGIYSLSPYTMEEVIARDYLIKECPDAILNIIDGTNLERNLYLTTQLIELGMPVIIAINMMDLVKKRGDEINIDVLSKKLGCQIFEISALKGTGISELSEAATIPVDLDKIKPRFAFSDLVEKALSEIEQSCLQSLPENLRRWYSIKIFERDIKVLEEINITDKTKNQIEEIIQKVETEMDDDSESIISSERYANVDGIIQSCYKKKNKEKLSVSDKIDRVVTNRFLGLPIFAIVMFLVYWISMVGVGAIATDFTNDKIFGDGFFLFSDGGYSEIAEKYSNANDIIKGYEEYIEVNGQEPTDIFTYTRFDEETLEETEIVATIQDYTEAESIIEEIGDTPLPKEYGIWIDGIPVLVEKGLCAINTAEWLKSLILDGVVAGVGSVLGFVPQMFILFLLLAFLEACGYMARIAFVMDRIFRKFGLSGKSFIPMLIGTGCGVPGIMASRTIENERDRRMTIMTTTFIPCSAKIPFISMISGAIFGGSAWIATSAYFVGMVAIILSGTILKKTKMFKGEPAPFVMELPPYHMPTIGNILHSAFERALSFIKKAGTVIFLSTVVIWFATYFGFIEGQFRMLTEEQINFSFLAYIGKSIAWIFAPLGWENWQATVASITGLLAKENIVGTMGIIYGSGDLNVWQALGSEFSLVSGYAFLVFNLLCAPCFAAIGAIRREMNSTRWTLFAIIYQCAFAYLVALCVNQIGNAILGELNIFGFIAALAVIAMGIYMLVRPEKRNKKLSLKVNE